MCHLWETLCAPRASLGLFLSLVEICVQILRILMCVLCGVFLQIFVCGEGIPCYHIGLRTLPSGQVVGISETVIVSAL